MAKCSECDNQVVNHPNGRQRLTCSKTCRNTRDYRLALQKKQPVFSNCLVCSKTFKVSALSRVYCSKECRKIGTTRKSLQAYYEKQAAKPDFKEITCSVCEQPVILPRSFTQKIASHPHCKEQRLRARENQKRSRRKGAVQTMKNLTMDRLGDRDNWTCHICSEPVDPLLPGNHRLGPTVDHVIPLSKGGSNDPDNLKLAHWICNIRKSDKVNYAQSR